MSTGPLSASSGSDILRGISEKLDLLTHFIEQGYNEVPLPQFQAGQQTVASLRHRLQHVAGDPISLIDLVKATHDAIFKYAPEALITKVFAQDQLASIKLAGRIAAIQHYFNTAEKIEDWQAQTLTSCRQDLTEVSSTIDEIAATLNKPQDGFTTAAKMMGISQQLVQINNRLDTLPRHIAQHRSFSVWQSRAIQEQKLTRDAFSRILREYLPTARVPQAKPLPPAEQRAVIAAREQRFWQNFQRQANQRRSHE